MFHHAMNCIEKLKIYGLFLFYGGTTVLANVALAFIVIWQSSPTLDSAGLVFFSIIALSLACQILMLLRAPGAIGRTGHEVAAKMPARLSEVNPTRTEELRLRNIIEEMALVSEIPAPTVYVIEDEPTINAFVVGSAVDNAVIGVTRGALTRLTRDELQAMAAHCFSRIYNGGIVLDLRLAYLEFATTPIRSGVILIIFLAVTLFVAIRFSFTIGMILLGLWLNFLIWGPVASGWLIEYTANLRQRQTDIQALRFTRSWGLAAVLEKYMRRESASRLLGISRLHYYSHFFFGSGYGTPSYQRKTLRKRIDRVLRNGEDTLDEK